MNRRMFAVTATKIRSSDSPTQTASTVGRVYEGYLLSKPAVGRGLVLFRDPNGRRMVTTAVRRIFTTDDESQTYVETENSVYRLLIRDAPPLPKLPTVQIRHSGTR